MIRLEQNAIRFSAAYKVAFATANQKKLEEAARFAQHYSQSKGVQIDVVGLPPQEDVAETGDTFSENALIKLYAALKQGVPQDVTHVISEDAGFEVDALKSLTGKPFPGVHANRWLNDPALQQKLLGRTLAAPSDADRNEAIRAALKNQSNRNACYVTVMAMWTRSTQKIEEFSGAMELEVIGDQESPRGNNGFAYDTIVKLRGDARTVAEMSPAEKDRLSHRGQALGKIFSAIG